MVLCITTSLDLLISSSSIFFGFMRLSLQMIMSSVNTVLHSLFHIDFFLFFPDSADNSSTIVNKRVRVKILALFLIWEEAFQTFLPFHLCIKLPQKNTMQSSTGWNNTYVEKKKSKVYFNSGRWSLMASGSILEADAGKLVCTHFSCDSMEEPYPLPVGNI